MIREEVQEVLNQLIQIENLSSTLYMAMSAHLSRLNYRGMANWLRLQSDEERGHMVKLIDYLVDRGGKVELRAVAAQPVDFGSPLEVFKNVLEHEQSVTNAYRQIYDFLVKNQADPQTIIIVQDFLREQIDEVAQAETIVSRLTIAGDQGAGILLVDQELGQRKAV